MTKTPATAATTSPASARQVEYLPLSSLVPDERNPKAHDQSVIESSVGRFGFIEPIVRDGRTGKLISGHGRTASLQAMHAAGQDAPEGITATTTEDGGTDWLVPVVTGWSSRTDTEARGALIALNRAGEVGGWVDDALLDALADLTQDGEEDALVGIGFTDDDLEALQRVVDAHQIADAEYDEDDGERSHGNIVLQEEQTREVVVVIPVERYQDLYALLHPVSYIVDIRDRAANA